MCERNTVWKAHTQEEGFTHHDQQNNNFCEEQELIVLEKKLLKHSLPCRATSSTEHLYFSYMKCLQNPNSNVVCEK